MTRSIVVAAVVLAALGALGGAFAMRGAADPAGAKKVPLTFSGGHEIGKGDHGRPVVLIAAALGVKPEVFREAFSGVTPAKGGKPSKELAQRNKAALMKVLAPHGVTNERLDEVSDYYRYRPQRGERWRTRPAKGYALVEDGEVKRVVVTEPGSGYSSPPEVKAKGMPDVRLEATLGFSKVLEKNGAVTSVKVVPAH
jgi:hypothetical protein